MKNEALDLRQIFENNSDCYADTWNYKDGKPFEGDVIMAMTKDKFVQVVNEILCEGKPVADTEANEVSPGVKECVAIMLHDYSAIGMKDRRDKFDVVDCNTGDILFTGTGKECKAKFPNHVKPYIP